VVLAIGHLLENEFITSIWPELQSHIQTPGACAAKLGLAQDDRILVPGY